MVILAFTNNLRLHNIIKKELLKWTQI